MDWPGSRTYRNKVVPWPTNSTAIQDYQDGTLSDTKVMFMRPVTKSSKNTHRGLKLERSHSLDARLRPKLKRTDATEVLDIRDRSPRVGRRISPTGEMKTSPRIVVDMARNTDDQGQRHYEGRLSRTDEFVHLKPEFVKDGKRKSSRKRRRSGWRNRKGKV
jgi:hypothetical protein